MRKREFMRELTRRLNDLPAKEKENIIEYYDELIEDTIERTGRSEEDVIYDLGSLNDIARKVSYGQDKIRYEEKEDIIEVDDRDIVNDNKNRSKKEVRRSNYKAPREYRDNSSSTIALKILVLILTFPLWSGLIMALIGIIVGFGAAGVGMGIGGIYLVIVGILKVSAEFAYGLFHIGAGTLVFGAALIIFPLLIKFIAWLFKQLTRFIGWLAGSSRRKGDYAYEN